MASGLTTELLFSMRVFGAVPMPMKGHQSLAVNKPLAILGSQLRDKAAWESNTNWLSWNYMQYLVYVWWAQNSLLKRSRYIGD